jgi:hypothetical protein
VGVFNGKEKGRENKPGSPEVSVKTSPIHRSVLNDGMNNG